MFEEYHILPSFYTPISAPGHNLKTERINGTKYMIMQSTHLSQRYSGSVELEKLRQMLVTTKGFPPLLVYLYLQTMHHNGHKYTGKIKQTLAT